MPGKISKRKFAWKTYENEIPWRKEKLIMDCFFGKENVLGHKGCFEKEGVFYLKMDLAKKDLFDYCIQKKGPSSTAEEKKRDVNIAIQMVDALCTLHSAGIAHMDVKLENFLLFKGDVVKICDFEFCIPSSSRRKEKVGTPSYASPEIMQSERKEYDPLLADAWSMGVCLFSLFTGRFPFQSATEKCAIYARLKESERVCDFLYDRLGKRNLPFRRTINSLLSPIKSRKTVLSCREGMEKEKREYLSLVCGEEGKENCLLSSA